MRTGEILRRLLAYIRRYLVSVFLSVLLAVVTVVLTLYIPICIGEAVDRILGPGAVDWEGIVPILRRIGISAACCALSTYVMNLCNNRVCFGVVRDIRREAFHHIQELPVGYLDSHAKGDIVSRVITDADTVSDGLLMGFSSLFTGVITILGTLFFMFTVSVPIALTVVAVTPLSLLVARFIARRSYTMFQAQSKDRGEQTAVIEETFANLKVVQAFGQEERFTKAYDETAERLKKDSLGATFFSSITNPATRFVNSMVYAAVGVFGAMYAVRGGITVGMLSCFLSYANQYTKPFNEISGVITELQNAIACAGRLMELLDEPGETESDDKIVPNNDDKIDNVVFDKVSFSYDKEKELIRDLDLVVEPGCRVAIVGPTGAGKSTIINLLMRFYDVDQGRILVREREIREMSRDELRAGFGMVLQETWLPSGTIRENIAMGREVSEEDIVKAAKAAHAHEFIRRLPAGYDTRIGEDGGSLSAGQKQLLCIARVMISLPPMLILDEATSSIDTRTEALIQNAFAGMMKGRTSFIVAHRLQTIREADVILVMRDGKIVEQGNHEELIRKNGFYKELYEASRD